MIPKKVYLSLIKEKGFKPLNTGGVELDFSKMKNYYILTFVGHENLRCRMPVREALKILNKRRR